MKLNSIKLMTTAMILIVGMVTISIFGFFSYKSTKASLDNKYFKESELLLEHTVLDFQEVFNHTTRFMGQLVDEEHFQNAASVEKSDNLMLPLQLLHYALPGSKSIKLGLENGSLHVGSSVKSASSYDPRNFNWYENAKHHKGEVIWTEPYLDYDDQTIIITAAQAVINAAGNLSGIAAVDYELSSISRTLSFSPIGASGLVILLNPTGTVIANTGNQWIGEQIFGDEFERIAAISQKEQMEVNLKGAPYYLKASTIKENGMLIVTAISMREIEGELWEALLPIFILGFICLAAFGIIAYIFALRAISPMERLVVLMKLAEHGNYEVQANVDHYDEIQSLSKGFNNMIEGIKKRDEALNQSNQHIYQLAYYDSLTGLLNRRNLIETVNKVIADKSHKTMALIYIDLDNFKMINDTLGHLSGDEVLVEVSRRLQSVPFPDKDVGRIGGDEFIMVLYDVEFGIVVERVLQQIIKAMEEPVLIGSSKNYASLSLGAALYPGHGNTLEELLQKADLAMYRAKKKGKSRFSIFDESLEKQTILK